MPDAPIVERIRDGDTEAARPLLRKYGGGLRAVGMRVGLSEADAEEVVNDVFLAALTLIREGKLGSNIGPWLFKVMKNRAIDRYRHDKPVRDRESEPFDEQYHTAVEQSGGSRRPDELHRLKQVMQRMVEEQGREPGPSSEATDLDILIWIAHGATNEELAEYLNITAVCT